VLTALKPAASNAARKPAIETGLRPPTLIPLSNATYRFGAIFEASHAPGR
jgi:hypothetical protein